MGWLLTGVPIGLRLPTDLAGDAVPYVPSAPVQIGTSGPHRGVAEAGSWQVLLVMFGVALILGTAVLMFAVRQRTRLLRRRRVRRMGEAAALMAAMAEGDGGSVVVEAAVEDSSLMNSVPVAALTAATPPAPPRTTPATPGRPAPTA